MPIRGCSSSLADSAAFSGNDITGHAFSSAHEVETLTRPESISNATSDTNGSKYSLTTTTSRESSSATTSGNDVTGAANTNGSGASTATMLKTDTYGSGDSDTQTIGTVGTDASVESGNDITGGFSLKDTSSETVTTTESGSRSGGAFSVTSTDTSSATTSESGNSITGAASSTETTSDSTTLTDWNSTGGSGATGYTISQLDLSSGTVTGNENTITGVYTQATLSSDTTSIAEQSTPLNGSLGLSATETTGASSSGTETGDTITGAYSGTDYETDSSTLTQSGTNTAGAYSLTAVTSESPTITETGDSISGGYTLSESGTQDYTFNEANSTASGYMGGGGGGSSYSLTETGDKAYARTESGSHTTGQYSLHETGTDSFTIAESGGTDSGGGGGGGGGSISMSGSYSSSSSSSSTWGLTLSGADNYTTAENGNELSGLYSRATSGGGADNLSESGSIAQNPYNSTPSTGYTVSETGNYLSGEISLGETGLDRYALINGFNNVSNAQPTSNGPGDIDYSPVGAPFRIGGSALTGAGPAAPLNAAASDAAFNELGLQLLHEYCFPAGTPLMHNGEWRLIEDYVAGGQVSAVDDSDPDGAIASKRVAQFFENQPARLWHVRVNGEVIPTTANHPFYVRGRGFVAASLLGAGDELRSYGGEPATVTSVTETGEIVPVYNVRVADFHTYFVGTRERGIAVLVHNASAGAPPQAGAPAATPPKSLPPMRDGRPSAAEMLGVAPPAPAEPAPRYRRLGERENGTIGPLDEIRQLPATLAAFPEAFRDTQQNGKQADSLMGHINGYTDSLNPFGGGIPTKPIAGNEDAYRAGQGLGHKVGFVANMVMTVSGVKGTITGIESVMTVGGNMIKVGKLATATGETVPIVVVDGEAVILTAERAAKLGLPASEAAAGEVNLLQSTRRSGGTGGGMSADAMTKLRELGLGGVELAGKSFNSGRKVLEEAGFVLETTTQTGRKVFRNAKTGAEVYYDSGKALARGQKPHWHIKDKAGKVFDRSGRSVGTEEGAGHIPAG